MNTSNTNHNARETASIEGSFRSTYHMIKSLKAEADAKRTRAEKLADWMTAMFGTITFLAINVIWFVGWLVLNSGVIPNFEPFDPFPFGLLNSAVSLEAIILAIFVLISQNRAAKIAELREEVDLQVDIVTEQELTKLLHLVSQVLEKQGVDLSGDKDLQEMLQPTNLSRIEKTLEKEVVNTK